MDRGDIELIWHGGDASPELEMLVVEDIRREFFTDRDEPACASDILFHHVFLSNDRKGPCIFVWGEKDDNRWHCQYETTFQGIHLDLNEHPDIKENLTRCGLKFEDADED